MELATTLMTVDKQVKRHPIVQEMQESIQAFRAIGAEIELQPILDYLASRELREAGSGNILAPETGTPIAPAYYLMFGAAVGLLAALFLRERAHDAQLLITEIVEPTAA